MKRWDWSENHFLNPAVKDCCDVTAAFYDYPLGGSELKDWPLPFQLGDTDMNMA